MARFGAPALGEFAIVRLNPHHFLQAIRSDQIRFLGLSLRLPENLSVFCHFATQQNCFAIDHGSGQSARLKQF